MSKVLSIGAIISLVACVHAASPSTDLPARIKAIAGPAAPTMVDNVATYYYTVLLWRPPRGYQATLTVADQRGSTPTIFASIYERVGERQLQLLKLVDEGGDGTLDYVLVARAPSISAVNDQVRAGNFEFKPPDSSTRAAYASLVSELSAERLGASLAANRH